MRLLSTYLLSDLLLSAEKSLLARANGLALQAGPHSSEVSTLLSRSMPRTGAYTLRYGPVMLINVQECIQTTSSSLSSSKRHTAAVTAVTGQEVAHCSVFSAESIAETPQPVDVNIRPGRAIRGSAPSFLF